ncbi:MAG: TonB-dependent receptor [Asticcacaulis sp.]
MVMKRYETPDDGARLSGRRNAAGAKRRSAMMGLWLASSAIALTPVVALAQTQASVQAQRTFNIPAQPLADALILFGEQSGLTVSAPAPLTRNLSGRAISGRMNPTEALGRILDGSGLTYRISGNIITIEKAPETAGSIRLGAIRVEGAGGAAGGDVSGDGYGDGDAVSAPYRTGGAVSHISAERIERYRGSSPADIFRGTPGVLSGDARSGTGAIDVNIRGMQGMGRVRVTVDGAENAVTVYQGYQGQSNQTFLDPDLVSGMDITKGGDPASRGMAGTVAVRTISALDVVKPGETWGIRVRGGLGTNTSKPAAGAKGGYVWPTLPSQTPNVVTPSADGMDRPNTLEPTTRSFSVVMATAQREWDFLLGYVYRKQGNYHAGEQNGEGVWATPVTSPKPTTCNLAAWVDRCANWDYKTNAGLTNYRPGEEVLNTELETHSLLAKGGIRFGDSQSLQFSYNGYRGEAGGFASPISISAQATQTLYGASFGSNVDTGTLRHRWNPADNDLINLTTNLWATYLQKLHEGRVYQTSLNGFLNAMAPQNVRLPAHYRTGTNTFMWGTDITNVSQFYFDRYGELNLSYGASYSGQEVTLRPYADVMWVSTNLKPPHGARDEAAAFVKAVYKPLDWLTVTGGLRYARYWSERPTGLTTDYNTSQPSRTGGGYSPSIGVMVEPWSGVQFYANYGSTVRLPSLIEVAPAFTFVESDLKPERLRSIDLGVNYERTGLLAGADKTQLKFGYFNWDVKDYISRNTQAVQNYTALRIHNIPKAKFEGVELSGRYEIGGFTGEIGANYYTDVEFCATESACGNMSLYGDYGTNHIPPEYTVDLSVSQKFLSERLRVGGRAYHVGPRAAGHGDVTSQGYAAFITQIRWKPYTLVDAFAEYDISENLTVALRAENLTDQYYVDPLGLMPQPGPGRTITANLTSRFGGGAPLPQFSAPFRLNADGPVDWTGIYGGFHAGSTLSARIWGKTVPIQGDVTELATGESADFDLDDARLLGLQFGYNHQLDNRWIVGVEVDLSKPYIHQKQEYRVPLSAGGSAILQARNWYEVEWDASVRGRVGYAITNRAMVYGTAGLAYLRQKQARDQYRSGTLYFVEREAKTRKGYTLGAGTEYALTPRWSVKAEYDYSAFGKADFRFDGALINGSYTSVITGREASNKMELHTVKTGLNYRF